MIAFRRLRWNSALDRAIELARELRRPLVILEALRCDYPWASDRLHRFVMDGMAQKRRVLQGACCLYYPYVERVAGEGRGLLAALAERACAVVADECPCFFLPQMVRSAAEKLSVRMEAVDSNGMLPLRAAKEAFGTAHAFRRFLQKTLPEHLPHFPRANPLSRLRLPALNALPATILKRWPAMEVNELEDRAVLAGLPIDHRVRESKIRGGEESARSVLRQFLDEKLKRYDEDRNDPDEEGASGLSPYLHFGHISSHEIFSELMNREKWSDRKLALRATGSRRGWWGVSEAAEAFLDQFITWREVGFNFLHHRSDYDRYESLPAWAKRTLAKHARDKREYLYTLDEFADARTHDPLWNAAQRQLVAEGRLHNYMRMLWGKKILEWARTPQEALAVMIELNNRYAIDGRDPNSYSGIFWCLGRYDRPWGPERPVFGNVRFMSSANTARKLRVKDYLRWYQR
jgi:deoxyribodipyrimidine photo-lyase